MNGTKTQDELIRDLPPEISNLLFNTDLDFYLMNLLGNYGIADDQKMLVVLATRALLVGDIAPTEFVKLVSTVTGLDQSKSSLIAQDINRDVFNPVKDALKLVHSPQAVSTTLGVPIPTPYRAAAPLPQTPPRPTIAMPMPPLPQPTPSISNPPRAAIVVQEAPVVTPVLPKPMQMPPPPVVNNLEAKQIGRAHV